jgi:hypothetical protein
MSKENSKILESYIDSNGDKIELHCFEKYSKIWKKIVFGIEIMSLR